MYIEVGHAHGVMVPKQLKEENVDLVKGGEIELNRAPFCADIRRVCLS